MEMTKEDRQEWVKSLKKGDPVALRVSGFNTTYRQSEVKNITPKGKIRLIDDTLLDETGYCFSSGYTGYKIFPITDEEYNNYAQRENLLYKVRAINFNKMSSEDLKKVVEVLGL